MYLIGDEFVVVEIVEARHARVDVARLRLPTMAVVVDMDLLAAGMALNSALD